MTCTDPDIEHVTACPDCQVRYARQRIQRMGGDVIEYLFGDVEHTGRGHIKGAARRALPTDWTRRGAGAAG